MKGLNIIVGFRGLPVSQAVELTRRWADEDATGLLIQRATFVLSGPPADRGIVLPQRWSIVSAPAAGLWDALLEAAGEEDHAALVLLGAVNASVVAAGVLLEVLEQDPKFGAAAARVQCQRGCCVHTLGQAGSVNGSQREWLPRQALYHLRSVELTGDIVAPCLAIRPVLTTDFSTADHPFESLLETVLHRLAAAQRCGFRTVVSNRALVRVAEGNCQPSPLALPAVAGNQDSLCRTRPIAESAVNSEKNRRLPSTRSAPRARGWTRQGRGAPWT